MQTEHARRRVELARRIAEPHLELGAVSVLVVGSAAVGDADEWSDLDLGIYYDRLPGADELAQARDALGAGDVMPLGGDHAAGMVLEQFPLDGVACQLIHQTFDAWRASVSTVLDDHDTQTPTQKALVGLHGGLVLHGADRIDELRSGASYPEALATAMVRDHQQIFPLWALQGSLRTRDAELWQRGELVKGLQSLLAMLAAVNRRFFSSFQLKQVTRLVSSFEHAPPDFAVRLQHALTAPIEDAVASLETMTAEVLDLVEAHVPEADTSALRARIGRRMEPAG